MLSRTDKVLGVMKGENIMSHYSDCYYEANKEKIEQERKAEKYRKEMLDNLGTYEMIRLMFTDFLYKKSDYDVIDMVEKFLA